MSTCDARIRPFRPINDTEVACFLGSAHDGYHAGALRDYAYPGSETRIEWQEEDRRNFRGPFIPCGDNYAPCILPWHHGGNHEEG